MDHSLTFARHFVRLVLLLINESGNIDEQKAALRALVTASRDIAVTLGSASEGLTANGNPVPEALTGAGDVASRMTSHGIAAISVDAAVPPSELLGLARILSGTPASDDSGSAVEAKRAALGATAIRFSLRPRTSQESAALPEMEFGEMLEEQPIAPRLTPRSTAILAAAASRAEGGGMFDQFSAARAPTGSHEHHLAQLEATDEPGATTRLLDDLVVLAENAAREGKPVVICEILDRVVKREAAIDDPDSKRAFLMALRRLARPVLLGAVAMQLPLNEAKRDDYVAVLARAGEDGADALIEQIAAVTRQSDRRVYFDVLLRLQSGVPALLHMLGDNRWFVARNAAELLGEMQAREAEQPLTDALRHEDDRVRRSATGALMRLGTPRAMQAIQEALKDPSPQLRMEAAAALLARKDVRTASILLRALDVEKDNEVQAAFLLSLGKLGSPDAVQRLLRAAEAERGLFKKKTSALRVAATQALAEARSQESMDALRTLQADKDPDVRDAATFGLGRIARQSVMIERLSE